MTAHTSPGGAGRVPGQDGPAVTLRRLRGDELGGVSAPGAAEGSAVAETGAEVAPLHLIDLEGGPVGFLTLTEAAERHAGEVSMWVAEPHRGRGIATAALSLACTEAASRGLRELHARVPLNAGALHRVLERNGFWAGEEGTPAQTLLFRKTLQPPTTGPAAQTHPASNGASTAAPARPLLILVAGPYRSGSGDDPALMAANLDAMHEAALHLFRAGHLPVAGEDLALPLVALAGSTRVGDAAYDEVFHPLARRLLSRCDAVLRIGGPSTGADEMVAIARERGAAVYTSIEAVPPVSVPRPPTAPP